MKAATIRTKANGTQIYIISWVVKINYGSSKVWNNKTVSQEAFRKFCAKWGVSPTLSVN